MWQQRGVLGSNIVLFTRNKTMPGPLHDPTQGYGFDRLEKPI